MEFFTMCMLAAGFGMAIGAFGTGIGQGLAVKNAVEGVSRNPGASGKILTTMMIGLAMIESLAIYVLVVCSSSSSPTPTRMWPSSLPRLS